MRKIFCGVHSVKFFDKEGNVLFDGACTLGMGTESLTLMTNWKEEAGHTRTEMARRLGVSLTMISHVMAGRKNLSRSNIEKLKEITRREQIINGNPADVVLLKYELEEFIEGC